MLRIGITYNPSLDLFYSGANQTSIILFELFKNFDYKVILVDSKNTGTKKIVKESFASKPIASTKPAKQVLSEGHELAERFKKLAGLNKRK
jgi:hypothetical protein